MAVSVIKFCNDELSKIWNNNLSKYFLISGKKKWLMKKLSEYESEKWLKLEEVCK